MEKKIGVVTFHRAINYGAAFQTYALQKCIRDLGYAVEVLDYRCDFLEKLHNPYNLQLYRTPFHFLRALLKNRIKKDNRKAFRTFQQNNVVVSAPYDKQNLYAANDEYSAFIVGSDQVWNYQCTNFDKTYFLDFVTNNHKKYSYAASVGINLNRPTLQAEYLRLLGSYRTLCVREAQGQQELAAIGLDAVVALDPTLLLNKAEWLTLATRPQQIAADKKYLLVYVIIETPSIFETARKIASQYNLEIIYINEMLFNQRGVLNLKGVTPNEWLWLFANAQFIVTNSFHGTAFSVNFEKQFAVEPLPVKTNVNSRIFDFLKIANLSDRIINANDTIPENFTIDYKTISIQTDKMASMGILQKILQDISNNA